MKKRNIVLTTAAVLAAVIVAACVSVVRMHGLADKSKGDNNYESTLGNGIYIESSEAYSGAFWEDGTDREVEDVWKLRVVNTSDKDIRLLNIRAEAEGIEGKFEITTLAAGSTVDVLEASAQKYPEDPKGIQYETENLAFFSEPLTICPETVTLYGQDNWIKAENISDHDISQDVFVYYKNVEDGIFQGGITYRARFPGGIGAGQSAEQQIVHYKQDKSRIMYVTVGQEK